MEEVVPPAVEQCGVCLDDLELISRGFLSNCDHAFHFDCILRWAQVTNLCPLCKTSFLMVSKKDEMGNVIESKEVKHTVQKYVGDHSIRDEYLLSTRCEVCGLNDREEILLLCDGYCGSACHTECIGLSEVPEGSWYCHECVSGQQTTRRRATSRRRVNTAATRRRRRVTSTPLPSRRNRRRDLEIRLGLRSRTTSRRQRTVAYGITEPHYFEVQEPSNEAAFITMASQIRSTSQRPIQLQQLAHSNENNSSNESSISFHLADSMGARPSRTNTQTSQTQENNEETSESDTLWDHMRQAQALARNTSSSRTSTSSLSNLPPPAPSCPLNELTRLLERGRDVRPHSIETTRAPDITTTLTSSSSHSIASAVSSISASASTLPLTTVLASSSSSSSSSTTTSISDEAILRKNLVASFLERMSRIADADIADANRGWPASRKLIVLSELQQAFSCIDRAQQESYLANGCLLVFTRWLKPLPNDHLPHENVIATILGILSTLPVSKEHIRQSGGLGKLLVQYCKRSDQSVGNLERSRALLDMWSKLVFDSSSVAAATSSAVATSVAAPAVVSPKETQGSRQTSSSSSSSSSRPSSIDSKKSKLQEKQKIKFAVAEYVKEKLQPYYQGKKVSKDEFRFIAKRVTSLFIEELKYLSGKLSDNGSLCSIWKTRIKTLVYDFVKKSNTTSYQPHTMSESHTMS